MRSALARSSSGSASRSEPTAAGPGASLAITQSGRHVHPSCGLPAAAHVAAPATGAARATAAALAARAAARGPAPPAHPAGVPPPAVPPPPPPPPPLPPPRPPPPRPPPSPPYPPPPPNRPPPIPMMPPIRASKRVAPALLRHRADPRRGAPAQRARCRAPRGSPRPSRSTAPASTSSSTNRAQSVRTARARGSPYRSRPFSCRRYIESVHLTAKSCPLLFDGGLPSERVAIASIVRGTDESNYALDTRGSRTCRAAQVDENKPDCALVVPGEGMTMLNLNAECHRELVARELIEGFDFEPKCLVLVAGDGERAGDVRLDARLAGRIMTDPFVS